MMIFKGLGLVRYKVALPICLCFLTVGILVAVYPGAVFSQKNNQQERSIIYIFKTTADSSEFWNSVSDGIEAGSREFGFSYDILGASDETDIDGNIAAVEQAIAIKPDVIVLSASNYEALEDAARHAVEEGIILLTLDSGVAGDWAHCYVGSNNYEIGRLLGEELKARIGDEGKIALIGHIEGAQSVEERLSGALDSLASLDARRILPTVFCDGDSAKAKRQLQGLFEEHPDISGVIATNEDSALGAGDAVSELKLKDTVTVITCDNALRQISYLEQGVIDATIAQKPFNMGYISVQTADRLLRGGGSKVPEFYDTGVEIITVDNMFTIENQKLIFPFRG